MGDLLQKTLFFFFFFLNGETRSYRPQWRTDSKFFLVALWLCKKKRKKKDKDKDKDPEVNGVYSVVDGWN
jgi:hypothetical protein